MKIDAKQVRELLEKYPSMLDTCNGGAKLKVFGFEIYFTPDILPPIKVRYNHQQVAQVLDSKELAERAVEMLDEQLEDRMSAALLSEVSPDVEPVEQIEKQRYKYFCKLSNIEKLLHAAEGLGTPQALVDAVNGIKKVLENE